VLLPLEGLAFEDNLADVEAVAQQMRERSAGEWNAADRLARPSDVAKVSASGRQSLSGDFAVLSLAAKFAFPGNRRRGLQRLSSRFYGMARPSSAPRDIMSSGIRFGGIGNGNRGSRD
jgi:hypothetical protein